jgi:pimeloyl-ACP methyl ester carboxylesterase
MQSLTSADMNIALHPWHHTTSSGITLRGYETPVTGKPMVHFIHGTGFNGMVYWPMLRHLLPHVDLVITNAQGHGGSDTGEKFLGWEASAVMIHEVLLHKQTQWQTGVPVIGMGHSFGAIVSTLIANRSPPIFDRLLLLDPVYLPPTYATLSEWLYKLRLMEKTPMVKLARKRRSQWPSKMAARETLHQRGVFRGWHDDALDAYVEHALHEHEGGATLLTPPWLEAEVFSRYASRIWPAIRQLQTPCHVIRGNRTFSYVKTGLDRACRINSRVTQETMEGDHCFMQQHPQAVCERLLHRLKESGVFDGFLP